jgi:hypothetical protein
MSAPLVSIITATTGADIVMNAMRSVGEQTYSNIEHIVVYDGLGTMPNKHHAARHHRMKYVAQSWNTGRDGYNGHRVYGAYTYLCNGDYVCYLDEDNTMAANHIEELVKCIGTNEWAYSLRKIVDIDNNFICNDDCESLGDWLSVCNDYFVDVNCFFLSKQLALQYSPLWFRRARQQGVEEVDRILTRMLRNHTHTTSGIYSINYRAGNTDNSVKPEFFIRGNEMMLNKMRGETPWRKI